MLLFDIQKRSTLSLVLRIFAASLILKLVLSSRMKASVNSTFSMKVMLFALICTASANSAISMLVMIGEVFMALFSWIMATALPCVRAEEP